MKDLYVSFTVECRVEVSDNANVSRELLAGLVNDLLNEKGIDGIEEDQITHFCDEEFGDVISFA